MVKYFKSEGYKGNIKIDKEEKIAGRNAIRMKYELSDGKGNVNMLGYKYFVSTEDVTNGRCLEISVVKSDLKHIKSKENPANSEITKLLNSVRIEREVNKETTQKSTKSEK